MPVTDNDIILIEKSLDNALSDAEQVAFSERARDTDFARESKLYEKAVQAVRASGALRLKNILQEEEAKLSKPKPSFSFRRFAIAASLLIAVGVGTWFWSQKSTIETNVFADNFKPYSNYEAPSVREGSDKTNLEKAFSLYDNGEYAVSIKYFESIVSPTPDILFFKANAYLASNRTNEAIPIFEKLSKDSNSKWQQKSEWYLALALTKTSKEKAKIVFEKIKNTPNHPYKKKAAEVLGK